MKKRYHGAATKSVRPAMQGSGHGSNLTFPNPSQAIHVAPQKDRMAADVGGDAHMSVGGSKSLGHQDLIETGAGKGPRKVREQY